MIKEQTKTVTPNIFEQQIILTCKGHNKNHNSIEAIRNIFAQQLGLETKYIDNNILYHFLIKIVKKYSNCRDIHNFIYDLFERKNEITIIDAIKDLMSILTSIQVLDDVGKELIRLKANRKILDWVETN